MYKYNNEIDGLRAVAVIPVILFHLGYGFFKGGFLGVDVFFVISGYLITLRIFKDFDHNFFSIYAFWKRRIYRLFPVLLFVIVVTLTIVPSLIFKPFVNDLVNDVFPTLFCYYNFYAFNEFGSYWSEKAEHSFFLHTWSLSLEIQFYIIYPIICLFLKRYSKNIFYPIIFLTIFSLILFILLANNINAFYTLPTRFWEFTSGTIVALLQINKLFSINKNFSLVGFFLVIFAYSFSSETLGIYNVLIVLGTSLIILGGQKKSIISKFLSSKFLVFIGKLSFSLYLWHWVLIVLTKKIEFHYPLNNIHIVNFLIVVSSMILSLLSYVFIEQKTRYNLLTYKYLFVGLVFIFCLIIYYKSTMFKPFYKNHFKNEVSYIKYFDISPSQEELFDFLNDGFLLKGINDVPNRSKSNNYAFKKEGIIISKSKGNPEILLIGDSHGVMWAKTIQDVTSALDIKLSCYTSNGTQPFINISDINAQLENNYYTKNQRIEYAISILENINKWKPKIVILACRWAGYNEKLKKNLKDFLKYLEIKGIKVLFLTQPPLLDYVGNKNANQFFSYLGKYPKLGYNVAKVDNKSVIKGNEYIKSIVQNHSNYYIFNVFDNLMLNGKAKVSYKDKILYFDNDHLSHYGTTIFKDSISKVLKSMF